ncbi:MAG: competence/damage-inducible protein A [Chthoniobacteraceae bacterium]
MRVEVINTGTELLLGNVINTHLKLFAEAIFPLGLRIERQVTVPDGLAIRDALVESFSRAQIVFVTGGLGPTTDDVTREITADLLGVELVHDEEIMRAITARFARRGLTISERVGLQAMRPREAVVLPNAHGTAPGLYFPARSERASPHLFLLPGPPRELRPMFHDTVVPLLQIFLPARPIAEMRTYRIAGVGESGVEKLVGEPLLELGLELGYCARPGEVDLRIIGDPGILDRAETIIIAKLGAHIVSHDQRELERVIVDLLSERRETIATAESCTGGFLAHRLTNVPGASAVFMEGFVTYANEAKMRALGVGASALAEHGAVSAVVAQAMAEGARRAAGVDHALATTGIAGPSGGSEEKPVGTVFIALATKLGETIVQRHRFPADRETFKFLTTQTALDLLRRRLLEPAP